MEYDNYEAELEYLRELESSLNLENTSFIEARGHWDRKLMANIVEISEADNYDDARLEWRATGRVFKRSRNVAMNERLEEMAKDWGHPVGHCICGHSVVYHYEIENTLNGNITVLGSDHIENYHIARRIVIEDNIRPEYITDSHVKTWRKNSENEMSYREYQASGEYAKHKKRVALLEEIDNRFNTDTYFYALKPYTLSRTQDIKSLDDIFDLDAMVENSLDDLIKVKANSLFKKTPSVYNSDSIFAYSSIQYRSKKAERANKKPPASLLSDMSEMIAQRREVNDIIQGEKDFLIDSMKINFRLYMVNRYSNFVKRVKSNLESKIFYSKNDNEYSEKAKSELLEKIRGFTNKQLLDSLDENIRQELYDYGVLKLLQERDDDFVYHDVLSDIFSEDNSVLFAGRKLLNPVTLDLESLQTKVDELDIAIIENNKTIALEDVLDKLPDNTKIEDLTNVVNKAVMNIGKIDDYIYGLSQTNFYSWKRYISGETEMMSDAQKDMFRRMGNELANRRDVMTRFRLKHSQSRYEKLLNAAKSLSREIANEISLEDYLRDNYEIMIPQDFDVITLNQIQKIKPSVEGLNTEQNIQEVN